MKYITEYDANNQYDEFLDEMYGEIVVNYDAGLSWQASRVVKEMDPTAYRCGLNDWLDSADLTTDESEADLEEDEEEEDFNPGDLPYDQAEQYAERLPMTEVADDGSTRRVDSFGDPLTQWEKPTKLDSELTPEELELCEPFGPDRCNVCGDPDPDHAR